MAEVFAGVFMLIGLAVLLSPLYFALFNHDEGGVGSYELGAGRPSRFDPRDEDYDPETGRYRVDK